MDARRTFRLLEWHVLGEAELKVRAHDVGREVLEQDADEHIGVHVDKHVARLAEFLRHDVAHLFERSDHVLLLNVAQQNASTRRHHM